MPPAPALSGTACSNSSNINRRRKRRREEEGEPQQSQQSSQQPQLIRTTYHHTVVGRNRRRCPFIQPCRLTSGKGWFVVFQIHCQLNRTDFWRKDQFAIEPVGQADTVVQVVFEHGEGVPQGHQMGGVLVAFVKRRATECVGQRRHRQWRVEGRWCRRSWQWWC